MASDPWQEKLAIVRAGLERFASEGYLHWSKANVEKLFHPVPIDDPRVVQILDQWQRAGAIHLNRTDDDYMTVVDTNQLV